jgi:hypothetical protein
MNFDTLRASTHQPAAERAVLPGNHFLGKPCIGARSKFLWGALAAFLLYSNLCGNAAGQGQLLCAPNAAVTPTIRAEGLTERIGDIVVLCTGGVPFANGAALPQTTITLFLNTAVTSRIQDTATGASEALLVIDDAGSSEPSAPATQLACGTPVTGCTVSANGGNPYDGTPGHPNVFEGFTTGNTVIFSGVPIQPPGTGSLLLRFVNIRVNANVITIGGAVPGQVFASISTGSLTSTNSTLTVAYVQPGLVYRTRDATDTVALSGGAAPLSSCTAGTPCRVATLRFGENFGTAFAVQSLFCATEYSR